MKKVIITFLLVMLTQPVFAKHLHLEREYQNYWCNKYGGITEYRLSDDTRVDILTKEYAVEVDFANKWAESIGQALYYGIRTNRKPAVLLIMENPVKDKKYLDRLKSVAIKHGITVFTVYPCDLK